MSVHADRPTTVAAPGAGGDRQTQPEARAGGISDHSDPLIALLQQPSVRSLGVLGSRRMRMIGQLTVVENERPHAGVLGDMRIQPAMRVHRAADEAAAMQTKQHLAVNPPSGQQPHRTHSGGLGLHKVDTPRLGGGIPPPLLELAARPPASTRRGLLRCSPGNDPTRSARRSRDSQCSWPSLSLASRVTASDAQRDAKEWVRPSASPD